METTRASTRKPDRLDRVYLRPVLPLLITLMAGIWLGVSFPGHALWAWASAGAGLIACGLLILRVKSARWVPLGLFLAAGYLCIQPWMAPRLPTGHVGRYVGPVPWEISATVLDEPIFAGHRTRLILRAEILRNRQETVTATGKVRLTVAGPIHDLRPGDRIRFSSRLHSPRNFNNPGGFDYRRYLAFRGIRATAFCRASDITRLARVAPFTAASVIHTLRDSIAQQIAEAVPNGDSRDLLNALILGDRTGLSDNLRDTFNRTGVSHLLAISGLHIGVVAAGAFGLLAWVLSFLRPLLWQGSTKRWAAWLALFPVAAYGLLAGMSPSTQRAVIMVSVFLATIWFGREQDPLNTLALAALVILGMHPPALFSVSFQLSFSAVAAIILGTRRYRLISGPEPIPARKIVRRVSAFFLVSALAILGTLPLTLYYFNQVSLTGLLANAVAVPLIGGCVVPMGLFSALIGLAWSHAAVWGFSACAWLLDCVLQVLGALSAFPLAAVKSMTPTLVEIALYYLVLGGFLNLFKKPARRPGAAGVAKRAPVSGSRRKTAWLLATMALAVAADTAYWLNTRFWHRDLRATIVDVGQGSAALLEFPGGPVILVDGGGFPDYKAFDVGARVVAPLLWRKKIRTVDILVLSHPDADHLNGLLYIAEHFHVGQLWSTGDRAQTESYQRLLDICQERAIERVEFAELARVRHINGARVEILHPPVDVANTRQVDTPASRNNNSLVIRVGMGPNALLIPGDLMAQGEAQLVRAHGPALQSTVLIAPHHGSRTSSTAGLLDMVAPEAVIVSAAVRGRSHPPHPAVMARYAEREADVLCTATAGAVEVSIEDQSVRIRPTIGRNGLAARIRQATH